MIGLPESIDALETGSSGIVPMNSNSSPTGDNLELNKTETSDEVAENENGLQMKIPIKTKSELSYFDDALFIGDSRTEAIRLYSGWENTTFYDFCGLTIWDVLDRNFVETPEGTISVRKSLEVNQFSKIYVMLGINELGRGTKESFAEQYKVVLDDIRALQPNAIIYLQSILHITEDKDLEKTYIVNSEIDARNEELKKLTNERDIFWLDANEVTDDPKTGALMADYSSDGIHIKPNKVSVWTDFLLNNTIIFQ